MYISVSVRGPEEIYIYTLNSLCAYDAVSLYLSSLVQGEIGSNTAASVHQV